MANIWGWYKAYIKLISSQDVLQCQSSVDNYGPAQKDNTHTHTHTHTHTQTHTHTHTHTYRLIERHELVGTEQTGRTPISVVWKTVYTTHWCISTIARAAFKPAGSCACKQSYRDVKISHRHAEKESKCTVMVSQCPSKHRGISITAVRRRSILLRTYC